MVSLSSNSTVLSHTFAFAAYEVLSDSTVCRSYYPRQTFPDFYEQKRQIYDRHGEEGLKAHEGGQHQYANPFDVFSQFFGGGCTYNYHRHWFCLIYCPLRVPSLLYTVQAQEQVRRGPTSVSEFEDSLAYIYKGASI